MRGLEKCLFLAGMTSFGAFLLGVVPLFVAVLAQGGFGPRGGPDMLPGGGLLLILLALFGGGIGAFIGFVVGSVRLWRSKSGPWPFRVWVGVILGVMLGLSLVTIGVVANAPGFGKAPRGPLDTLVQVILNLLLLGKPFQELLEIWQIQAVLVPGLGMLGGILGKLLGRSRSTKPRPLDPDGWSGPGGA